MVTVGGVVPFGGGVHSFILGTGISEVAEINQPPLDFGVVLFIIACVS
jgi:hypothetical protein